MALDDDLIDDDERGCELCRDLFTEPDPGPDDPTERDHGQYDGGDWWDAQWLRTFTRGRGVRYTSPPGTTRLATPTPTALVDLIDLATQLIPDDDHRGAIRNALALGTLYQGNELWIRRNVYLDHHGGGLLTLRTLVQHEGAGAESTMHILRTLDANAGQVRALLYAAPIPGAEDARLPG
jgi:hypothetical protein